MPTLKQLTCNVEWAGSRLPLQEFHTIYADGYVETFIAIPSTPTPFSIHLRSDGYIAPGLAMFMDGIYQCNRNRRNLEIPDENSSRKKTEVEFIVRQKEELLWDGTFEGKQWRFERVKIVPDSNVEDIIRPPHKGEYVGTIEVIVLRCHPFDNRPIPNNETSSDESSDGDDPFAPECFDGARDLKRKSKSQSDSGCRAQVLGLDGGLDDRLSLPPPLDQPKLGRIEMTSENTGTWNPIDQESTSCNALEKTKRWDRRSESRDHFQSDFQKCGSPAAPQRGRSGKPNSMTDQAGVASLNLGGGGPGSYSIASSEAMRNWNGGSPALKQWKQGDSPPKKNGALPAAFDPWTTNLPTGDFTNEHETKPQAQVGARVTQNDMKNDTGNKKGSKKETIVSSYQDPIPGVWGESNDRDQGKNDDWGGNDQNQGNNGDNWGIYKDTENSGDDWGGAQNANAQSNDDWNAGGNQSQERNDEWNMGGGASRWNAPNNDEKKDSGAWDVPMDAFRGINNDWGRNENNDTKQDDEWRATGDYDIKTSDHWGATTGIDAQQGNSWIGDTGQQTDTWGGDDAKQVTTVAKDPEKENKLTSNLQAAGKGKTGSILSFGNSRAKGPKLSSKPGSQGKPASAKAKAASITSNRKPLIFDCVEPSLGNAPNAFLPLVAEERVSALNQGELTPVMAQIPPTFSVSTPPQSKPYWSDWRNSKMVVEAAEVQEEPVPFREELEEPVYSIPAEVAQRNMMSHQVRPGRPAPYTHKRNKPKYMDMHERPYAVFLFKYRDKEIIEHMLKTTITEPEVDEKTRLASLSKQELIDELMKTKSKLSVVESDSSGQVTFVKKLDEKLSKLETSGEDVPAVGDWVNTTSPTDGLGSGNAGRWGNNDAQDEAGRGGSGHGNEPSNTNGGDWGGDENSNSKTNGNGATSWGGNGDSDANGKSHWNTNGNDEVSNDAEENGNGGNDWDTTDQNHGGHKKDGNGWGGNDNNGGGHWSNNNDNINAIEPVDNWGENNGDTKAADGWGNDNSGGDSWDNDGGGEHGRRDGNDKKKDEGSGNGSAGGDNSWVADTGWGGGGSGGW